MALVLDAFLGDPRCYPHPIRLVGRLCIVSEGINRRLFRNQKIAGFATVITVISLTLGFFVVLLSFLHVISRAAETVAAIFILYTAVAARDLLDHSKNVYDALMHSTLEESRKKVGMMVGRDTTALDRQGVARACIESVAENMVDGITAPVFWAVLFSLFTSASNENFLSPVSWSCLGVYFYKAVNTMDSIFGYKNETYLAFGRYAAKLDDLVNFLPARLSGCSLIISAFILRYDGQRALTTFYKDRLRHSSPNAGHPEAAVAGALGIQLGGASVYFGEIIKKPVIGEAVNQITPECILKTNQLAIAGAIVFTVFICLFREFLKS